MRMFVNTDDDGRICVTTEVEEYAGPGYFEFEFPAGFEFANQNEYRIVDGELIHDPVGPTPEERITELKGKLSATDYAPIKMIEALITEKHLPQEDTDRYVKLIASRKEWRDEINRLQESSGR